MKPGARGIWQVAANSAGGGGTSFRSRRSSQPPVDRTMAARSPAFDRISFSTKAVGVPHLVKVSYFPNWRATGAEGPWRASPSLMVVVPTEEEVVLEFRDTWPESLGKVLSLGGVVTLVAVVIVARRPDEPETVTSSREDPAS